MTTPLIGWGGTPYGLGPLGSALSGVGIHVVSALAVSTNDVRVTLSGEPQHVSKNAPGDALNPATWTVVRLDTAALLAVVSVSPVTPLIYTVRVLDPFSDYTADNQISTLTLVDVSGALTVPPRSAVFAGIGGVTAMNARLATSRTLLTDIKNSPFPVGAQIG